MDVLLVKDADSVDGVVNDETDTSDPDEFMLYYFYGRKIVEKSTSTSIVYLNI